MRACTVWLEALLRITRIRLPVMGVLTVEAPLAPATKQRSLAKCRNRS